VVAVKNHDLPAHMPQVKRSLALIYAVNPFGADHQSHEHDPGYTPDTASYNLERMAEIGLTNPQSDRVLNREKVKMALTTEWDYCYMDSAQLCQFVYGPAWQVYGPNELHIDSEITFEQYIDYIDDDCKDRQSPKQPEIVPQYQGYQNSQKQQQEVLLAALTCAGKIEDSPAHRALVYVVGNNYFHPRPFVRGFFELR
jgi:hypothetical protein